MRREPGSQVYNQEWGPLLDTYERWLGEGLNPLLHPERFDEWCDAFGIDHWYTTVNICRPQKPLFKEEIIEETADTITERMPDGSVRCNSKGHHRSIYYTVRNAITSIEEWERYKDWMAVDASLPSGSVQNVKDAVKTAGNSVSPVRICAGSILGGARTLLGFESIATLPYDNPEWFEDVVETFCRAAEWQVRACGENGVTADVIHFSEDMCFKNGPIVNPEHFRIYAVPRYRRVVELAKKYGYKYFSVDSDGNLDALLPHWLDGGINVFMPLEVQAGMDINTLLERFNGQAMWFGGVHKYRLAFSRKEIEAELRRIRPALDSGCYAPHLDHGVPHDVSFENYLTYLELKKEILGVGNGRPPDSRVRTWQTSGDK